MNKFNALVVAAIVSITAATPAMAQFGGLGGFGGGAKAGSADSGTLDNDIKNFTEKSSQVNKYAAQALLAITAAYASDEERANAVAKLEKLNATTDPKEQNAIVTEINKSEGAKVAQLAESKDLGDKTKSLDKEKQKQVGAAVTNYLIAGARAVDLSKSGQALLQGASGNPMALPKLASVKDALPLLGDAASNAGKVLPKFVNVLRGAKIELPKVTADSKPQDISSI
ncbi:hypothetical protein [Rhodocyclus tenuis]|uniref:DUF4197 family protein n=1 Tax=Rhodocyclus tenuis TaxID=1066 RepID=A0A840G1X8_RHOTE|nr:hypothetical protein [Rhodocyclus tenuis]MBB4248407.1 hypothetical protein [Rhodocyclus tenuis]